MISLRVPSSLKPVIWLGDSLRKLKTFPAAVQDEMGYAIYLTQCEQKHLGQAPERARLRRAGGRFRPPRDTFRSVYTVRFDDRVFVLHAFQKKSKRGVATPKADIDLIMLRLKQAIAMSKKKE